MKDAIVPLRQRHRCVPGLLQELAPPAHAACRLRHRSAAPDSCGRATFRDTL
jgi:hypothetical protein